MTAAAPAAPAAAPKRKAKPSKSAYPDTLLTKVNTLTARLSHAQEGEVRAMVEIGREVQKILQDKSTYAVDSFKDLAELFRTGRDSLRPCYVLAERYTDAQIDEFLALKHPETGAGLFRSHLAVLSRVRQPDKALRLAQQAVEHGWTRDQLKAHVVKAQGKTSAGGKPRKPVHTLPALCENIVHYATNLQEQDRKVWRAKDGGFAAVRTALRKGEAPDPRAAALVQEAADAVTDALVLLKTLDADLTRLRHELPAGAADAA